jgi:hypothetical protein
MSVDTTARLAALRVRMRDTGADLVAIAPGSHMDWLLGHPARAKNYEPMAPPQHPL